MIARLDVYDDCSCVLDDLANPRAAQSRVGGRGANLHSVDAAVGKLQGWAAAAGSGRGHRGVCRGARGTALHIGREFPEPVAVCAASAGVAAGRGGRGASLLLRLVIPAVTPGQGRTASLDTE